MPALIPLTSEELYSISPFLLKLSKRRLAPSRLSDLVSAARSNRSPKEPDPWECCGSSCRPCVRELWREEKRVWEECHPDGLEEEESEEECDEGGPDVEIGFEEEVGKLKIDEGKTSVENESERGRQANEEEGKRET